MKILCSYGGKILPRQSDGKLRYHGGHTRVLSVHRSITFSELMTKLGEMCGGTPVMLRCQLPTEDLDALVSITSDEDLSNLIEEYELVAVSPSSNLKIRAFLSPPKSVKKVSSPPLAATEIASSSNSNSNSSSSSVSSGGSVSKPPRTPVDQSYPHTSSSKFPIGLEKSGQTGNVVSNQNQNQNHQYHHQYHTPRYATHIYLVHNGNRWQ